jgi:hypothetical protein
MHTTSGAHPGIVNRTPSAIVALERYTRPAQVAEPILIHIALAIMGASAPGGEPTTITIRERWLAARSSPLWSVLAAAVTGVTRPKRSDLGRSGWSTRMELGAAAEAPPLLRLWGMI